MVGFPCTVDKTVADVFGTLWSNGDIRVEDASGTALEGTNTMVRGQGYWVYYYPSGSTTWDCPFE